MKYSFDTQMEMVGDDVPRTVFESKFASTNSTSSAQNRARMVTSVHARLFKDLESLLEWHAENRKRKRNERLPRRPAAIAAEQARRDSQREALGVAVDAPSRSSSSRRQSTTMNEISMGSRGGDDKDSLASGPGTGNMFDDVEGQYSAESLLAASSTGIGSQVGGRGNREGTGARVGASARRKSYFDDAGKVETGASDMSDVSDDQETSEKGADTSTSVLELLERSERRKGGESPLNDKLNAIVPDEDEDEGEHERRATSVKSKLLRSENVMGDDDAYMECYPSYETFVGDAYGSDDEEPDGKTKAKGAAGEGGDGKSTKAVKGEKQKMSIEAKANREWSRMEKSLNTPMIGGGMRSFEEKYKKRK
eukprot:GHVN01042182.1.p1 GENE.GHVN01042182.1~~GHVN01042182.1.p1  ORF type:complete len:366 (-),score=75.59 GHVN01042182.1:712-1809(-)